MFSQSAGHTQPFRLPKGPDDEASQPITEESRSGKSGQDHLFDIDWYAIGVLRARLLVQK